MQIRTAGSISSWLINGDKFLNYRIPLYQLCLRKQSSKIVNGVVIQEQESRTDKIKSLNKFKNWYKNNNLTVPVSEF